MNDTAIKVASALQNYSQNNGYLHRIVEKDGKLELQRYSRYTAGDAPSELIFIGTFDNNEALLEWLTT